MTIDDYETPEKWALHNQEKVIILNHVARGLRYKEIAKFMGLSVSSIKGHMGRTRTALSAGSAAHAVAIAMRLGVIQ